MVHGVVWTYVTVVPGVVVAQSCIHSGAVQIALSAFSFSAAHGRIAALESETSAVITSVDFMLKYVATMIVK